jgi:ABC-2 type transport system ATP-binding protein
MISVQNVRVAYGDRETLHGISFSLGAGQIGGYVGPNGAGKTTTMRLLTGTMKPNSGRILLAGLDVAEDPLAAKQIYGYVPEHGSLYESFSPEEYLLFIGRIYGMDEALIRRRTESLLRYWKLEESIQQKMIGFSKGMKQKVMISAAVMHDPQVLLLDEPLNGLDAQAVLQMRALLKALAAAGKTILYSSHILDAVEKVVDRVIVIRDGEIVGQGSPEDLKTETQSASLELAFNHLTSTDDAVEQTRAMMEEAFETAGAG